MHEPRLLARIHNLLEEPGQTILELGSSKRTAILAKDYQMVSVEHDANWLNLYDAYYIHAPLIGGWYDTVILHRELPGIPYDLLLIGGPLGQIERSKILQHLNLFRLDVPIIVDDTHRPQEYLLIQCLAARLGLQYEIIRETKTQKSFGVIP